MHYNIAHGVRHNDVAYSQQNNHYGVYVWSDLAKQQYYYSTSSALQVLIESLPQYESSLSGHKYVDVLYTHLIDILKECSADRSKKFVSKSYNSVRWTQRLKYLKYASKDALNSWRVGGCSVNDSFKEKLVLASREYKKAVQSAKRDYKAVRAERLRHSFNDKNNRKFWRLVNNVCKRQNTGVVSSLDAYSFTTTFNNNF